MYIYRPCYHIASLSIQLIPFSIATFIPKAPSAGGSAARAGDDISPPRSGWGAGGSAADEPAYIGTNKGTNSGENTAKVFEKVIGIVIDQSPLNRNNNNDLNTVTITKAPVPTSAITDPNARACLQANDIHNRCVLRTPAFDGLGSSSQASCLCYGTTSGLISWDGQNYGGLMSSCYDYVNGQ
ncbi:MAG: hypothetical protein Q9226_006677, partial [Calogaya cf. arnoldii]